MNLRHVALASLALLMTGCGMAPSGTTGTSVPATALVRTLRGSIHGGQQPVSKSLIQLYAVSNKGSKLASTPLIAQTLLSDTEGAFDLSGLWNCNDSATYGPDPLLYLLATGGNPGLGAGANNSKITAMAALGPCSSIGPSTFISINEVTTVASLYALAPFMADATHVGSTAGSLGLAGAFATVQTLANTASGASPGIVLPGETVPSTTLNALANSMASCVNSDGTQPCSDLFAATLPPSGTLATDTVGAILQVVRNPAHNAAAIYNLAPPAGPFQPTLSSTPADWTVMLRFTGGGISSPAGLAVDAAGNIWIANASGSSITGMDGQGNLLTGATGYTANGSIFGAQGVAVDTTGNVWVADTLLSTVLKLTVTSNAVVSSSTYSTAINGPAGIAIDHANHIWLTNFGDGSVTELDQNGNPLGASPITAGGTLQAPSGIAIDPQGNAWVSDNGDSVVVKFDQNRALLSGPGYTDNALVAPLGIALDASGRAWIAGNGDSGATLLAANGSPASGSPVQSPALSMPVGIAIDGASAAWVTTAQNTASLAQILQTAPGLNASLGQANQPQGVAIDASGNLWTANSGDDSVGKFVGLAAPVTTPLAATVGP